MTPYARKTFESSKETSDDVAAARSASLLAVCHVSCWASSVILGVVSIWIRHQATQGIERSIFGVVGVGVWGSLPYLFAAALSIRASKVKTFQSIRGFFISSILSLICSVVILAFSSIAVAIEASFETLPRRRARVRDGGLHRSARISPADEESGHVTVMALPARQAAELFYTMYRPFFQNVNATGLNLQDMAPSAHEQFYPDGYDTDGPADQRKRRNKRSSRSDMREYDPGYPNEYSPYAEGEYSEDEVEFNRSVPNYRTKRQGTPHRQFHDEEGLTEEPTGPANRGKLAPVLEDEDNPDGRTDKNAEPVSKTSSNPEDSKPSNEKRPKLKDQRLSKGNSGKEAPGDKDGKDLQGAKSS